MSSTLPEPPQARPTAEGDPYASLRLDSQLCFPLYAASRLITKLYRPCLEALDLTYTQYIAMLALWESGTLSVKDLGARLYLDSGTLTPVLKSLEGKGYIRRCRCRSDERVLLAELTDRGLALRERALPVPERLAQCISMDREEAASLYRLLCRLLDCLRET